MFFIFGEIKNFTPKIRFLAQNDTFVHTNTLKIDIKYLFAIRFFISFIYIFNIRSLYFTKNYIDFEQNMCYNSHTKYIIQMYYFQATNVSK